MIKVIITVRGGLVSHVCSNDPDVEIVVLDHDNFNEGDEPDDDDRANMKIVAESVEWGKKAKEGQFTTLF